MSIKEQDIYVYGSTTMAEDDTTQNIGGAISTSVKVSFEDLQVGTTSGLNIAIVASTTGATDTVTVWGRNPAGEIISEAKSLSGRTPVLMTTNTAWDRLMKAVKGTSGNYHVLVYCTGIVHSGIAQGGAADSLQFVASAGNTLNQYQFKVGRIKSDGGGGAISGHLFEITSYATDRTAQIRPAFSGTVGTPNYDIYDGMLLQAHPNEILTCRRVFWNAAADVPSGSARTYYDKIFFVNKHATLSLTQSQILEVADPTGNVDFVLTSGLNDTNTNGANNRQVAPTLGVNGTFTSAAKNVPNSQNHTAASGVAVWLKLSLAAGAAAQNTYVIMREQGQST